MKLKKEYLVLVAVIVALCVYLLTSRSDRTHYRLPELPAVDAKTITRVEVARPEGLLVIQRAGDDEWTLTEKAYPADKDQAENLLRFIEGLTLTALVSETRSYERYGLGPDAGITVKAYAGETPVRTFEIGKAAPSFSHTFVKLEGDTRVYQAKENFRDDFESPLDALRDKKVMVFKEDDITGLEFTRSGKTVSLEKEAVPKASSSESTEKDDTTSESSGQNADSAYIWKHADGRAADKDKIDRTVHTLSGLVCEKYVEGKKIEDFKNPEMTLTLTARNTAHTLKVFARADDAYPAVTSQNAYPFMLSTWQVENLIENLDPLPAEETKGAEAK